MEMIKKSELIDGKTYLGFCRNNFIATWDARENKFYMTAWQFGAYVDWLEHYEDVQGKFDGFVPVQIIERLPEKDIYELSKRIGY